MKISQPVAKLLNKGVRMPNPFSVEIGEEVDTERISAKGVAFFGGTRITGENSFIDNTQKLNSAQGAGIQSAKTVINAGAGVLISGNVGPKAFAALESAKIEIYTGAKGSVGDAIEEYRAGRLTRTNAANVESHW